MTEDNAQAVLVSDWLEAFDPASLTLPSAPWQEERLKRLHGYQIVLDVIAHAHDIPLRLVRIENLVDLDGTFLRFVSRWESDILSLLTETYPDNGPRVPGPLKPEQAYALLAAFKEPRHLLTLRDWMLQLACADDIDSERLLRKPDSLPNGYAEWFLVLLPHFERDVWLTDAANPLPAHNLARMVDHWSLYLLMWAWHRATDIELSVQNVQVSNLTTPCEPRLLAGAMGIAQLGLLALPAFRRRGREADREVVLLTGPFYTFDSDQADRSEPFTRYFQRFLRRIERVVGVEGWHDAQLTAPDSTELDDAFGSGGGVSVAESIRRATCCRSALLRLFGAQIDRSVTRWPDGSAGRPISRANWETMAALAAWQDRWNNFIHVSHSRPGSDRQFSVSLSGHRVSLGVSGEEFEPTLVFRANACSGPESSTWREAPSLEDPNAAFARIRERQQSARTAHVAAISHLLARHSNRFRPEGADDPGVRLHTPPTVDEADHLLRGFGGRVCRYLLSMAPAEVAEIYWIDFGSDPPHLRHVGSAEHLIQHRARRQAHLAQFNAQTWERNNSEHGDASTTSLDVGSNSPLQIYRAIASGQIEPTDAQRKVGGGAFPRPHAWLGNFTVPRLLDAVSVPLLFNDRVVGVLSLSDIAGPRVFDRRLYPTLRLVAQVLAQTMYFHSQVWHMRQINWLASHVPLEEWRQHDSHNDFNPLRRVADCLANVFLCPSVQIWLKDRQNSSRFFLHGNTLPNVFTESGEPLEAAPHLVVRTPTGGSTAPLSRSFLAFAVDQWANAARRAPPPPDPPLKVSSFKPYLSVARKVRNTIWLAQSAVT